MTLLKTHQLSKTIDSHAEHLVILHDINLTVEDGTSLAIVGPSGAGKSTLLSLLAGLDLPSSGYVTFQGQNLSQLNEDERAALRARNVGFVFQDFQLLPSLTALENVLLPLELIKFPKAEQRAQEVLSRVGISERLKHYPNELSGGEQQRVAIARAYAANPKILFADEVTANLDQNTGEQIAKLLFALNREQQTTLVLVTHDDYLATECQQRLELQHGQVQP